MVTLFRIAKGESSADGSGIVAGVLLAIVWFAALAPASLLDFPSPWNLLFVVGQPIVWGAMLIFLVYWGWRGKTVMQ
jgi:hypothetical protein